MTSKAYVWRFSLVFCERKKERKNVEVSWKRKDGILFEMTVMPFPPKVDSLYVIDICALANIDTTRELSGIHIW